jgi:predicted DNA-binding antitoxin AbrB/MazE fold protein
MLDVDAVYENGVLRPLQPLDLPEHQRVVVRIIKTGGRSALDVEYVENLRREMKDAGPASGLEDVRRRLAKIPGSMAAEIVAERGDR